MSTRTNQPNPALLTEQATRALPRGVLFALIVAYSFAGLVGRDPWRTDDAIGFGIGWTMAHGHWIDWLMPNVAGMPLAEEGPLTFWLSAITIKLFAGLFGAPVSARIPIGLAIGFATGCIWYATYILGRTAKAQPVQFMFGGAPQPRDYGRAIADGAVLTLMATVGLLLRLHELSAEALQFAWLCMLLWGLARSLEVPRIGAVISGLALAALCLTRGWQAAIPAFVATAALLALHPPLAAARRAFGLIALPLAVLPLALWCAALHWHGPDGDAYLRAWWHWNSAINQGFLGGDWLYYSRNLWTFGWPALPFALIAAWRWRTRLSASHMQIPLALLLAYLLALVPATDASEANMAFVLPGAIVVAAFLLPTLSRSAINAIDWFALMALSFSILLIWLGWIAQTTGFPPTISNNFLKLAPGFTPRFSLFAFAIAAVASAFWVFVCYWRISTKPLVIWRAMVISCSGLVATWVLLTTLWMPWLNHTRTYRDLAQQVQVVAKDAGCVSTLRLGLAQRASFAFFGGLSLEPHTIEYSLSHRKRSEAQLSMPEDAIVGCRWLLTQDSLRIISENLTFPALPNGSWRLVWEGRRPSDRDERFRLYERID